MRTVLRALHFAGIQPDSLGTYLTGLGLLSAASSRWPDMRGCWRDDSFVLVHTDCEQDDIAEFLLGSWQPPQYPVRGKRRLWLDAQQKDTRAKTGEAVALERSECALEELAYFDSHLVSLRRNVFNPVFGKGGGIGRRDLAKVARDACGLLAKYPQRRRAWLERTLYGTPTELPSLEATGTWFIWANRMYNSGRRPFQEGRLSPWSFLLALNGALLLRGGVGRRMGTASRPYAVFPFVAQVTSPLNEEEARARRATKGDPPGEFWAPVWGIPSSLTEVKSLLQRGRARVGGRDAISPHEFGLAAILSGVDAGVTLFVPFELRPTTSTQTFEGIARRPVRVGRSERTRGAAALLAPLVAWVRRLPVDGRGPFVGLRGPVEQAILRVSEDPDGPEPWQHLLMTLAITQGRIDRNREWRTKFPAVPVLPHGWLDRLCQGSPPAEFEVASALASVGAGTGDPLLVNVFGVSFGIEGRPFFPAARPQRTVWHDGNLLTVLAEILRRRLVDADPEAIWPLEAGMATSSDLLGEFLRGALDDEEIARWVPPLSLLRWDRGLRGRPKSGSSGSPDGLTLLDALFRPLLATGIPWEVGSSVEPSPLFGSRLVHLLQHGDVDLAIDLAVSRYRALGLAPLVPRMAVEADGERLAAGLLIPLSRAQVVARRGRWLLDVG